MNSKDVVSTVKSIPVKAVNCEDKLNVFQIFRDYTNVCGEYGDTIMSFSGRRLKNPDGEISLDSPKIQERFQKKYGITPDELETFFVEFSKKKQSRTFAAHVFQEKTDAKNESADVLREKGVFPLKYRGQLYDFTDKQGGYKYAVIGEVHSRITSWIVCDAQTKADYDNMREEYHKVRDKIVEQYDEEVLQEADKWATECRELNFFPTTKARNFLTFLEEILIPNMEKGAVVTFGTIKNPKGIETDYSINPDVANILFEKYKILWQGERPILLNPDFYNYVENFNNFSRKREYSSYTRIGMVDSPVRLRFGNNYVQLKKNGGITHDPEAQTITLKFKYPKSLEGDNSKEWIELPFTYKRSGSGIHQYFENLVITPNKDKNDNLDGTYTLEYSINGKRKRTATLKEPSLRLKIRNQNMDFNNPKVTDFDFYLDLSLNVHMNIEHSLTLSEAYDARKILSTALPAKDGSSEKTKDITNDNNAVLQNPVQIGAVDLGVRNPYAYAVYEYDGKSTPKLLNKGVYQNNSGEYRVQTDEYRKFKVACFLFKKLLNSVRYVANGHRDEVSGNWLASLVDILSFLDSDFDGSKFTTESLNLWMKNHKETKPIHFKLKQNGWMLRELSFVLRNVLLRLTRDRLTYSPFENSFSWIAAQEEYIKCMNSYLSFGVSSKTGRKTGRRFKKLRERIKNIKLDYMKKVSFHISEMARQNKVCILVTEKLDNLRGNVYNDKDQNLLFNTWPVGQIKFYIENALSNYGILRADVDERNSSQVVSDSGKWGYRDSEDLDKLWWEDEDGNVYYTHADINAAENLVKRYVSQHQFSLRMVKLTDTFYVPISAFKPKDMSKREKGFLTEKYGTCKPVFELKDGFLKKSNKQLNVVLQKSDISPEFKKMLKKLGEEDCDKKTYKELKKRGVAVWYANGLDFEAWMDQDRRDLIINDTKTKIEKTRS